MITKDKIIQLLVEKRYSHMSPTGVAAYFDQLDINDKIISTEYILKNNNSIAREKILEFMKNELSQEFDSYYSIGAIPVPIVEELLS